LKTLSGRAIQKSLEKTIHISQIGQTAAGLSFFPFWMAKPQFNHWTKQDFLLFLGLSEKCFYFLFVFLPSCLSSFLSWVANTQLNHNTKWVVPHPIQGFVLSSLLSWVVNTQLNHWTRQVVCTQFITEVWSPNYPRSLQTVWIGNNV